MVRLVCFFLHFAALAANPFLKDKTPLQLGIEFYQAGKFEAAEPYLKKAGEGNAASVLSVYQQFFLADTLVQLGKAEEAEPVLKAILIQKPPAEIKNKTLFLLTQREIEKNKLKEAKSNLKQLVKTWKSSPYYAEVLYRLVKVEQKLRSYAQACEWAKKLYVRFPTYAQVTDWSVDMQNVSIDGQKLNCSVKLSDFQDRLKRLQWAGESDRARKEMDQMRALLPEKERMKVDLMSARYLKDDGLVEDSLSLLVRLYPEQKEDFNYLTLLGTVAARAGEYQTAVGAYEKAHDLSPRSKRGREALFQSAFLSYQFQDYDGAVRKFSDLVKQHSRSGLARDAQWHLAWLQYLRSDFEGALKSMTTAKNSMSRSRKSRASSQNQRLQYWIAMSQFRLNQMDEAKKGFNEIIQEFPGTYYALAAQARLVQLNKDVKPEVRETAAAQPTPMNVEVAKVEDKKDATDEDESEDELTTDIPEPNAQDEEAEAEPLDPSDFKEPALKAHLEAARELTALNQNELARWELWEVERRTTNPIYLRLLISAYEALGSYNRSASISELVFAPDRLRGGIDGARALWVSAFPQAYKKTVESAAGKYAIPTEWIWGIMRAESLYRTDVISPVGARGLMQLMPFTARNLRRLGGEVGSFKVETLIDSDTNITLGAQYLARLGRQFRSSLPLVAAAYNAGPHRVQSWLVSFGHLEADEFVEHIPFVETRNYVKKVVLNNSTYKMLYGRDASPFKWLAQPLGVAIPSKAPTRESWDSI